MARSYAATTAQRGVAYDEGLRSFMLGVYNYMAIGLAISGFFALLIANTGFYDSFYMAGEKGITLTTMGWIATLAPLGMLLYAMFANPFNWSVRGTQIFYFLFVALQGVGLALYLRMYTDASVVRAFFLAAGTFCGMSLYGYTTKRNLNWLGTFCMMGLIGLLLAALVFMFFGGISATLMSVAGILLISGLTAYDTQKLKEDYDTLRGSHESERVAIWGALNLYLNALLLFKWFLSLTGQRSE